MQSTKNNIGIIGVGAIGKALAKVFEISGSTSFWDIEKSKCNVDSMAELVEKSDIIFLAVPSWAVKSVASQIKTNNSKIVVTVAKGVEQGFVSMNEVLSQQSNATYEIGVLYGPMLARELMQSKPTQVVLACKNQNWYRILSELSSSNFLLLHSFDIEGVAICGALKNIYSVAFGICDGLKLGNNAKGVLATKVFLEIQQVLKELGQSIELASSLVGIGDMLATGWSTISYNHKIGVSLAGGKKINPHSSEGVHAILEINKKINIKEYSVLNTVYESVKNSANTKQFEKLITYNQ